MNQPRNLSKENQIFVACLHASVVESDLYSLMSTFGQVVNIRILRNINTKESMGLAFITFSEPSSAKRARTELNGVLFKNTYIHVTLYCKQRNANANIFVKNLPPTSKARDLELMFQQFGEVVSAKVSYDAELNSHGFGYVQFENEASAGLALASRDQIFAATKIMVSKFVPMEVRYAPENNPNLYVRGFDITLSEDKLLAVFRAFGEVTSHVIMRDDSNPVVERYFAYVCYRTPESAGAAIAALNKKNVEGVNWYVVHHLKRRARVKLLKEEYSRKKESWKRRNLFLKNLPVSITGNMLRQLCEEYGPIESIKVHMTENVTYQGDQKTSVLVSNGSAFVCYVDEDSARRALGGLRNKMIEGKPIFVSMWKPREELVKALFAKKMRSMQRQMYDVGMFGGSYPQLPKPGRARAMAPQVPPMMPRMMPPRSMPPEREPAKPSIDIAAFNSAAPETQRRILGEQLYPMVLKHSNEKVAGKITGMLLEIEAPVLLRLIGNQAEVANKVREAIEVLRRAWAQNPEFLAFLP
jgi:polyadenylate-binding protein